MRRLLHGSGYHVRTADSVASALQVADTEAFDLLVCDIRLPAGSGLDLMRQLLAKQPVKGSPSAGSAWKRTCVAAKRPDSWTT
jgi:CheY-like chemotaxis protein